MDSHTDHIRNHHPIARIDKGGAHPPQELLRINTGNEREITEDHQARNVVDPGSIFNIFYGRSQTVHFGSA